MGKTKAKRAENSAQFKEIKAARKAAQAELDDSPDSSSSSRLPPLKRPKLNNGNSSRNNRKPHHDEERPSTAFFPIGLPLEGQQGERELDEAEKYLLSVREEEDRLPSFVTAYNPYVLTPSAPTPTPRGKELWIAGPSDPSPSFASSSSSNVNNAPSKTPSHPLLPTPFWRHRFLSNFLQLRANLKHPSTLPSPANPGFSTSLNPPAHYVPLPEPRDREKWRQYIVGASRKKIQVANAVGASTKEESKAGVVLMDCGRKQESSEVEPETAVAVEEVVVEIVESKRPSPPAVPAGDADDEEMMDAAGEGYGGDEDNEDDDGYQFGDATVEDGTEWYGVDGDEDEEIFPVPTQAELEEQLNDLEDDSSSDEEDEGVLELEPLQPKHLPKEPSLTLIQTLPESTILLLLAHLTHFLRPLPHLLNSQPSTSSSTPSAPPPSPYPTLTPLFTRWILSLLAKLDAHLMPSNISQLRDLARVMMEILESYAMGSRKREEERGSIGAEEKARREEERMGCWMIWGAVVEVWAQRDLVLDMEVVFGKL